MSQKSRLKYYYYYS